MKSYREILKESLPRLINQFDLDPHSDSFGMGDRLHWGWKVSDFPNATPQGCVHALSIAIKLNLIDKDFALNLIDAAINAINKIVTSKGSLQEAYPTEHSFCVTALVAFDVLSAVNRLGDTLDAEQTKAYVEVTRPLIEFITNNGEEHAIISNHLATGVAAIVLWNNLTGSKSNRHVELLEIIYKHQSSEGWHLEYEGADPGYQTLCLYYLCAAHEVWADDRLLTSIKKTQDLLSYSVHPDGTIGGLYGSRNTEVYYPGGVAYMSAYSQEFKNIEACLKKGEHVLPLQIDSGNFGPLVNAYAFAAWHEKDLDENLQDLPCLSIDERMFQDAGLYVRSTESYFAIVNFKKGGTLKVFDKSSGQLDIEDGGLIGEKKNGIKFSTQVIQERIDFENHELNSNFYTLNKSTPTALTTIALRLMSLTIFKSIALGNMFKRAIVKMMMTGKKSLDGHVHRKFVFTNDTIEITESVTSPVGTKTMDRGGKFTAIHMASSGYFMANMVGNKKSKIVTFK